MIAITEETSSTFLAPGGAERLHPAGGCQRKGMGAG